MNTLFKNAHILKMTGEDIFFGDLLVEGNRIKYIGKNKVFDEKIDEIIDCHGNLLMPGFKNCHTHSSMVFLRSAADDLPLQDWLFNYCFPAEANLTSDDIYHLSKLAFLEYISSGITACFDQYFFMDAFKRASEEMGFRSVICLMPSVINRDFGGYQTSQELYSSTLHKENLVTFYPSLHSEYTTSKEDVDLILNMVNDLKAPFSTHISETKKEVEDCINKRGVSPVKYFNDLGMFKHGGTLYHGIHLSDDDIKIIADNHVNVVTNPGSNTKLASGICDVTKLLRNGINVAIGTDGAASNNSLDMFKEMSLVSSLAKIHDNDSSALPADMILKMATVNGSKVMQLDDIDTLEVGKIADIIMIDLHMPNMQPLTNILKNIVYAGNKSNVALTMIDGKILFKDHKFIPEFDVEEIYRNAQKCSDRLTSVFKK